MIFKKNKYAFSVLLRALYLFITLAVLSFFILHRQWIYALLTFPFIVWALRYFIRYSERINREMTEFVEAIHYKDFTRHYALENSPVELLTLRKGLNETNEVFKKLSREKESQNYYLQKILELIDTGIISFDIKTGEVFLINNKLKWLLDIPHLKSINWLQSRNKELYTLLNELKAGENKVVVIKRGMQNMHVLMNATAFQTGEKIFKLIAFQNVSEALDETESQAWQKLLNVMTHEIMNSVAPIASLADTLKKRLQDREQKDKKSLRADIELGIDTIKRRSEGLTKFADTYRNLSKISRLDKSKVLIRDIFETTYQLMYPGLQKKNIELEIVLQYREMILEADRDLLEQVLINLILNAVEAVKTKPHPCITLSAAHENNKPIISVEDNGKGVKQELQDKIFIPFFSTKKNGNGIGLSLCKQIMLLHEGNIQVHTLEGEGTAFRLIF